MPLRKTASLMRHSLGISYVASQQGQTVESVTSACFPLRGLCVDVHVVPCALRVAEHDGAVGGAGAERAVVVPSAWCRVTCGCRIRVDIKLRVN